MLPDPHPVVEAGVDRLTIQLPPGVDHITITREAFDAVMDASAQMWLANMPDTPMMVTLHVAMKSAARAMLWFMAKNPLPGMPTVPQLTRKDDAVVVVVRFMLSWLFGTALRAHNGRHDLSTAVADVVAARANGEPLVGWDRFTAAVAGLVAGPRDGSTPTGAASDRGAVGSVEAAAIASDRARSSDAAPHADAAGTAGDATDDA